MFILVKYSDVIDTSKIFGTRVKHLRKRRAMTLPELAERAKISKGGLSKIENGKGNPTLSTIQTLARSLSVSPRLLI